MKDAFLKTIFTKIGVCRGQYTKKLWQSLWRETCKGERFVKLVISWTSCFYNLSK